MKYQYPGIRYGLKIKELFYTPVQGLWYVDIGWGYTYRKIKHSPGTIQQDLFDLYYSTYKDEKGKMVNRYRMNEFQLDHLKLKLR